MAPIDSPAVSLAQPSLWSRFSKFASEHKTLVYTVSAAAFVIVSGAGVYYVAYSQPSGKNSTSSSPTKDEGEPSGTESEQKAASDKKRAKKEKRKHKKDKGKQDSAKSAESTESKAGKPTLEDDEPQLPDISEAALALVSPETRKEYSIKYKNAGNTAFRDKNYNKAIELYTQAIHCHPDAVFYSNRAACYSALEQWENVIEDTSKALEFDSEYLKALSRRGNAYEKLNQDSEAIVDFTAVCLLTGTPTEALTAPIDKLLQKMADKKAKEIMKTRKPLLPSATYISAYLNSFHDTPILAEIALAPEESGDYYLKLGFEALEKKTYSSYEEAYSYFNKAVELNAEHLSSALEMRGTFKFLMADNDGALEDFNKSISLKPAVQAYLKRALVATDLHNDVLTNHDFASAESLDPNSSDLYYHKGQLNFVRGEFAEAAKNYQKSIDLDKNFVYAHIQLAITQYRLGSEATAMAGLRRCIKKFDTVPDAFNYYGEILMEQKKYDEAIEKFEQAFDLEKSQKTSGINVIALINKAYVVWTFKQGSPTAAEELLKKALLLDPQCEVAAATLAQLMIQQNRVEEALVYFEKQLELLRTEAEIAQVLGFIEAAKTQAKVFERYPRFRAQLDGLQAF